MLSLGIHKARNVELVGWSVRAHIKVSVCALFKTAPLWDGYSLADALTSFFNDSLSQAFLFCVHVDIHERLRPSMAHLFGNSLVSKGTFVLSPRYLRSPLSCKDPR